MKISPLDIRQKQFHLRWRGFDINEVDAFLEEVMGEMETVVRETHTLREELEKRDRELAVLREGETTLKQTLLTTQQLIDELKSQARREADLIIREAELKAEAVVEQANQRSVSIMGELSDLKRQKAMFLEKLRGLLDLHYRLLELDTEEDVRPLRRYAETGSGNGEARVEPAPVLKAAAPPPAA